MTTEPRDDGEWQPCHSCNGTGFDNTDSTGVCPICSGKGEVYVEPWHDEDEGDK